MLRIPILILLLSPILLFGQVKLIGKPSIRNYSKTEYKAGTQNWNIAQDTDGFMYFGNNEGVLRFDGISWEIIYYSPDPLRSIYIDDENRIYIGYSNNFGLLERDQSGVYQFTSLKEKLPQEKQNFAEIWRIYEIRQGIMFQSFSGMYLLENEKLRHIEPQNQFMYSFSVGERFFFQDYGVGLFEYYNWNKEQLPWSDMVKDKEIVSILNAGDNELLIGTNEFGFYNYRNGALRKWDTPASAFVEENILYSAQQLSPSYYAFGTILNGLIICDNDGVIVQHLNLDNGLINNTVLSLFVDRDENLWLGLDNGIAYVEINSPFSYMDFSDGIGSGYCSNVQNGKLYLGTNQGLFVRSFNPYSQMLNEPFKLVENTGGQVWSLQEKDGQLICGHNLGTYIIEGNLARRISSFPGAWKYIGLRNKPDYLLGGHYEGLAALKKTASGWEFYKKIKGFEESCRFLAEDATGNIWVSHGSKGVFRISLNESMDSVLSWRLYTEKDGLPQNEQNILLNFGGTWNISTTNGIYVYNNATDRFVPDEQFNELLEIDGQIKFVDTDNSGDLWFIAENEAGMVHKNEDFTYTKISSPFRQLQEKFVNEFEFLYPYSNDHVFIALDNGFAHYSSRISKSYTNAFKTYITKVEIPNHDSVIYFPDLETHHEFPFAKNEFRFYFTSPFYENTSQLEFSYFIENYSTEWSHWSGDNYRDINNLPEDKYIFKVKARNIYGIESEEAHFVFEITPPWYRSSMAYGMYGLFIVVLTIVLVWIIQRRVERSKDKERVKHKQELEKRETEYQQQALHTEKEIIRLRNEKLESEKLSLDKELANQTMSIIQKNKFLMKLIQELNRIQNETEDSSVKTKMTILKKRIDKEIDNEQQNKIFESYFDEVHTNFFNRLKEKYPQLSPKDLRLCAYIRMNISSKEIATLLNISFRGVEISRYRLRKKMDLSRDINLSTFLSNI